MRTWGTVLNDGGYQSPHLHPLGWLSGVYYVRVPDGIRSAADTAGSLEFGHPPERIQPAAQPLTSSVMPREGRLVIFPSWFYHRTMPFTSSDQRISIAFDVDSPSIRNTSITVRRAEIRYSLSRARGHALMPRSICSASARASSIPGKSIFASSMAFSSSCFPRTMSSLRR